MNDKLRNIIILVLCFTQLLVHIYAVLALEMAIKANTSLGYLNLAIYYGLILLTLISIYILFKRSKL